VTALLGAGKTFRVVEYAGMVPLCGCAFFRRSCDVFAVAASERIAGEACAIGLESAGLFFVEFMMHFEYARSRLG
jgi:hypothetical protein